MSSTSKTVINQPTQSRAEWYVMGGGLKNLGFLPFVHLPHKKFQKCLQHFRAVFIKCGISAKKKMKRDGAKIFTVLYTTSHFRSTTNLTWIFFRGPL
jgi:hypothetical protein